MSTGPAIVISLVTPEDSVAYPSWKLNAILLSLPVNPPGSIVPFVVSKLAIELLLSALNVIDTVPALPGLIT